MAAAYYVAVLERLGSGELSVSFPDFPGCVSGGKDFADAAASAEEALTLHVQGMVEDGDAIPAPTPTEAIPVIEGEPEAGRLLVRVEVPGKAVRVNITVEEGLLAAIDAVAARQGLSRSAFLAESARARISAL